MKRWAFWLGIAGMALLIVAIGCSSPAEKAQKLFNDGKYQEILTTYGNDPSVSAVVSQAKEKLAQQLLTAGKYDSVLVLYPETAAAKDAHNKLAEQAFNAGNFAEVIAKYGDTPWAAQAKAALDKQASANQPNGGQAGGVTAAKEKAAQAELDKIMKVKMKDLRNKALKEFVGKPDYAGTKAVAKARKDLGL